MEDLNDIQCRVFETQSKKGAYFQVMMGFYYTDKVDPHCNRGLMLKVAAKVITEQFEQLIDVIDLDVPDDLGPLVHKICLNEEY